MTLMTLDTMRNKLNDRIGLQRETFSLMHPAANSASYEGISPYPARRILSEAAVP